MLSCTSSQELQAFWVQTWSETTAIGHQVECVIRKPNQLVQGLELGLHTIPLVDDPKAVSDLTTAMEGADGVYHLAGIFDPSLKGSRG